MHADRRSEASGLKKDSATIMKDGAHPLDLFPTSGSPQDLCRTRLEWLALGLVLTLAASAVPDWRIFSHFWTEDIWSLKSFRYGTYRSIILLLFGLVLVVPTRRRSGLRLGSIRTHWRWVLLVCGIPPLLTAIIYPQLPVRPFAGASMSMWLISPLAQSLVFIGFIYGRLEPLFASYIHPRLHIRWALVITVLLFGLWHAPGWISLPAWYAVFQFFYTSVAYIVPALSRQWTGSIFYVVLCHSAVNFIAWYAS